MGKKKVIVAPVDPKDYPEPGIYTLSRDVENPDTDRRYSTLLCKPVIPAGTEFVVKHRNPEIYGIPKDSGVKFPELCLSNNRGRFLLRSQQGERPLPRTRPGARSSPGPLVSSSPSPPFQKVQ